MIRGTTRIAGVIGAPVAHSLSPLLMNSWIHGAGLDAAYIALPAQPDLGPEGFRMLGKCGLAGLNVTLPFKEAAAVAAHDLDPMARAAGAANLLVFRDDHISGINTDIAGLHYALDRAGTGFSDQRILVLGAGGVARAAAIAADTGGARSITIANRTRQKADELARVCATSNAIDWADREIALAKADIVVNATSLGLDGKMAAIDNWDNAQPGLVVFDTVYSPASRRFTDSARAAGLKTVDGLSMLIGQAIPSFRLLFDCDPPDGIDAEKLLSEALAK